MMYTREFCHKDFLPKIIKLPSWLKLPQDSWSLVETDGVLWYIDGERVVGDGQGGMVFFKDTKLGKDGYTFKKVKK